jgi:transposase-like protein
MKYVTVDVEVYLDEFSDEDLIEELEDRGISVVTDTVATENELLHEIFLKRRSGQDYQYELDQLIYDKLGRIA